MRSRRSKPGRAWGQRRQRWSASAILATTMLVASACSGFKSVAPDTGGDLSSAHDAGLAADAPAPDLGQDGPVPDLSAADLPGPDAGAAPHDTPCLERWSAPSKTDPSCAPRRVLLLDEGKPKGAYNEQLWTCFGLALALQGGELRVAFDNRYGPEEGQLRLLSFPAGTTAKPAAPKLIQGTQYERFGYALALEPAAAGGTHLAYVEVSSIGSQLGVRHWAGNGSLGPVESLSADVFTKGAVNLAETSDGKLHAVYYEDKAGRVVWRTRSAAGGSWGAPMQLGDTINSQVRGAGQVATRRHSGGNGLAHVVHFGLGLGSQPRYRRWSLSGGWTSKRSLDNNTLSGMAGYGIDLAVGPAENHAAYFRAPAGGTEAELWVASWAGLGAIDLHRVDYQIPHDDGGSEYGLALDVDPWGLLHMVVVRPSKTTGSQTPSGTIEYWRQRDVAGKREWISDVVDQNVVGNLSLTRVAIVVGPGGKPHIVYYDGLHAQLKYATRDDR